jgi:two-component system chemotaxis response regulator CheB
VPKLRVLIVDDSIVIRRILSEALSQDPDLDVFTAPNGRIALAKLTQVNPDAVTLDMEMPDLDGIGTLRELRKTHPRLPVVMFSTLTAKGAVSTLEALAAGASDYVTKPSNVGGVTEAIDRIKGELIPKVKALCVRGAPASAAGAAQAKANIPACPLPRRPFGGHVDIVAIGVSTGGPNALAEVLPALARDFPVPIVIVQHMPPIFTKLLADRLAAQCKFPVLEGAEGMLVEPGSVYIAPGGFHMTVERRGATSRLSTNVDPPENSCRPAVDVLFRSVAAQFGPSALAVVMTGMGSDGLRGCEQVKAAGGHIVVQDEGTSVVWGMPGFVSRAGLADRVLPLHGIAPEISSRVMGPSARAGATGTGVPRQTRGAA